jgi:hypothetical protein
VVPAVYAMFEDIKGIFGFGRKPSTVSPTEPSQTRA